MKPLEILSELPQWAKATANNLLASPAWAMPCRLGEQNCTMRLDALRPSETLDLLVRLGAEEHVLGLCDSENLGELHAVWPTRAEVPEPVLLALVEKECGMLLQLIENAVRISHEQVTGDVIMKLLDLGKELLNFPKMS